MRLRDFTIPAGDGRWLNADEEKFGQDLMDQFEKLFKDRKVELTPSIMLRTWEITTLAVIARRTIRSLDENGFQDRKPAADDGQGVATPCMPKKPANCGRINPAADLLLKVFDGMRKAVGELERACKNMGTPIEPSIVDELAPLMKRANKALGDNYDENQAAERARRRILGTAKT